MYKGCSKITESQLRMAKQRYLLAKKKKEYGTSFNFRPIECNPNIVALLVAEMCVFENNYIKARYALFVNNYETPTKRWNVGETWIVYRVLFVILVNLFFIASILSPFHRWGSFWMNHKGNIHWKIQTVDSLYILSNRTTNWYCKAD